MNTETSKKLLDNTWVKVCLAALVLLLVVLGVWLATHPAEKKGNVGKNTEEKGERFAHTEASIIEEETYNGLKFSNISLITDDGYTTFTADVTNVSEEVSTVENVHIELKDENGTVVISLVGNVGAGLEPGATKTLTASAKGEFRSVVSKTITE